MVSDYFPILVLFVLCVGFAAVALGASALLGPRKPSARKLSPYECGMPATGTTRRRFMVRFYLVAVLFSIFDIEIVFLYPWAVIFRELQLYGLGAMAVFIGILLLGYLYVWRKGGLEWD